MSSIVDSLHHIPADTSAEIGSGPASSSAHSEYRVLERYEEGCTLMSVRITTGVTHQIRVSVLSNPMVAVVRVVNTLVNYGMIMEYQK